jgi:hypothetical protein
MSDMTRDEYMTALRATMHVKNPTTEQMLTVCPHLTREQALDGLMGTGSGYIALPPLKMRHSFRTASYYPGNGTDLGPAFHGGKYGTRTRRSYADGQPHGDVFTDYAFMDEAMAYAEEHWPEELILDDWTDFQQVFVQDPTDLVRGAFGITPRTKFVISLGINRKWNDLINDHSRPEVDQWDDAIAITSVDPLISAELKGGRGGFTEYNCAHCGGGLGLTSCTACGTRFPDDPFRCGWNTPLPPKLIELLRSNGHEFALNPERLLVG